MTKEENKYAITLKTEWVDMDKLVLTNQNGDTYTTKSEELMDFILSSESENERLKAEMLPDGFKVYVCTDCQTINVLKDNGLITVGNCSNCEHPLWN